MNKSVGVETANKEHREFLVTHFQSLKDRGLLLDYELRDDHIIIVTPCSGDIKSPYSHHLIDLCGATIVKGEK
jgi:hypothetical protein